MGKILPRGTTTAINEIIAEVNNLLEPRDYDLFTYPVGSSMSFVRHGVVRTVQLRSHSGRRVLITLNTPTMERQIPFSTVSQIKEAAIFIANSFLPRVLELHEREAFYEMRCRSLEYEAVKDGQAYPTVVRLLRTPDKTNDDRHKDLDFQGIPRFGAELDNLKDV